MENYLAILATFVSLVIAVSAKLIDILDGFGVNVTKTIKYVVSFLVSFASIFLIKGLDSAWTFLRQLFPEIGPPPPIIGDPPNGWWILLGFATFFTIVGGTYDILKARFKK